MIPYYLLFVCLFVLTLQYLVEQITLEQNQYHGKLSLQNHKKPGALQ